MTLIIGLITLALSFTDHLGIIRIYFGHLFIFIFAGLPLSRLFIKSASPLDRLLTASLFSILLTYPASVLIALIEGQSSPAIFSRHLPLSISILLVLSLSLPSILRRLTTISSFTQLLTSTKLTPLPLSRWLILSLIIYSLFTFTQLNRPDVFGDEYDLAYQAYNLVDGIAAGRSAYLISFSGHPPLTMSLKHLSLNLLEPSGLDHLSDWHFRFSESILGLLTIIATYSLAYRFFSLYSANLTALLLSVNTYFIWIGRIYHREMLLTFLFTLTLYYTLLTLSKHRTHILTGIAFGAAFLTKETTTILVPILLITSIFTRRIILSLLLGLIIFTPVIIYNLAAAYFTGYADVFFSHLLGTTYPGATPLSGSPPLHNFASLISYLADLYSPPVLTFFIVSSLSSLLILRFRPKTQFAPSLILGSFIVITLAFFSLSAVRAYYPIFITIPFVILTASTLSTFTRASTPDLEIHKSSQRPNRNIPGSIIKLTSMLSLHLPNFAKLLTLSLILYSALYSYNSIHGRNDLIEPLPKTYDNSVIIPTTFLQPRSKALVYWSYQWGYKRLLEFLTQNQPQFDCLATDSSADSLAVRRYLWLNDGIKAHYLGDYQSRFPRCTNREGERQLILSGQQLNTPEYLPLPTNPNFPYLFLYQHQVIDYTP